MDYLTSVKTTLVEIAKNLIIDTNGNINEYFLLSLVILITLHIMYLISFFSSLTDLKLIKKLKKRIFRIIVKFKKLEGELQKGITDATNEIKKLKKIDLESHPVLKKALTDEQIERKLQKVQLIDEKEEKTGKISGSFYNKYNSDLKNFICEKVKVFLYSNVLHWEHSIGILQLETELINWMLRLFNAPTTGVGSTSVGGTESIFLSVLCYREYARKTLRIKNPEILINESAHCAFEKAAFYLNMGVRKIKINKKTGMSKISDFKNSINKNTCVIIMSAINYSHGLIDQITEINTHLKNTKSKLYIHVDSCLGGYLTSISSLKNDKRFPTCDFRLSHVGSISVDPHKYGRGPKGCSIILFRTPLLKKGSIYADSTWNGGVYATPSIPGSRSGVAIVGSWIALQKQGMEGLVENYDVITETTDFVREGINSTGKLVCIGEPKGAAIGFTWRECAKKILCFQIALKECGWSLPTIQSPFGIHISVTRGNCEELRKSFLPAVKQALELYEREEERFGGSFNLALYGTLVQLPDDEYVHEVIKESLIEMNRM